MAIQFRDSKERLAADILLRHREEDLRISRDSARFWAQIITVVLLVSGWGLSIRADVKRLSERQEAQGAEIDKQGKELRIEIDRQGKEMRMLQLDVKSLQLALAAKGIIVKGDL
jgi:hypothetical protein